MAALLLAGGPGRSSAALMGMLGLVILTQDYGPLPLFLVGTLGIACWLYFNDW